MKKNHIIFIVSIVVFLISLMFPAVFTQKGGEVYGSVCFLWGWTDLYGDGISWITNPILFFSWIFLLARQPKIAAFLGFLSLGAALYYLTETEIIVNEPGHKFIIASYGLGYYLWIASCVTMFIGSLLLLKSKPEIQNTPKK
ncbi:hypothetical protein [Chryseobacterium shigense]|uniref:Cellulose synthase/poly-beta-1,6-N-acetylglucosamine synthase-like glycosyltransferase n=1 Tax=Chryseobacterium shigense TaxID=297244 RepID=A0A841NKF8_9FLAO|nr:hypothetical protein [Chryseobacterium shigense]MBB6371739.1 cellulose synthase/poly-beta-1,6-N-acetylglucosamine synthase-like glycosyltransferase [Chryseobacterium shigense]